MKLIEKFTSGNPDVIIKAILMLRDTLPSPPCLKVLGILLISPDKEVEQCTSKLLICIKVLKLGWLFCCFHVQHPCNSQCHIEMGPWFKVSFLHVPLCFFSTTDVLKSDLDLLEVASAKLPNLSKELTSR